MIRNDCTPQAATASSFVKQRIIGSAKNKKTKVTKLMKMALYFAASFTLSSARSISFAPRFCPTSVAAALLNPHAGKMKKMTLRIEGYELRIGTNIRISYGASQLPSFVYSYRFVIRTFVYSYRFVIRTPLRRHCAHIHIRNFPKMPVQVLVAMPVHPAMILFFTRR